MTKRLKISLAAAAFLLLGSITVVFLLQQQTSPLPGSEQVPEAPAAIPAGWTPYCSADLHLSFAHPQNWNNAAAKNPAALDTYNLLENFDAKRYIYFVVSESQKKKSIPDATNEVKMTESASRANLLGGAEGALADFHEESCTDDYRTPDGQACYHAQRLETNKDGLYYTFFSYFASEEARVENEKVISTVRFLGSGDECSQQVLQEGVTQKGDKIFFYNKEKGYVKDGRIHLALGNGSASFTGQLDKVTPHPEISDEWELDGFYYDGLEVSDMVACGYGICDFYDQIVYKCNGPLIKREDYVTPQWTRCETDGTAYLTQYEFDAGNGNGFTTGGEINYNWYKLYLRRFGEKDLYFFGNLGESWWQGDVLEQDKHIPTKAYLEEQLQKKENQERIARWDAFVKSIEFTKDN